MADQDHLNMIEQGVDTWNQWRQSNPGVIPDLSRANLFGKDLCYINFRSANLSGANLSQTILLQADLVNADLSGAKLDYADLHYADLSHATLAGVNFEHVKAEMTVFTGTVRDTSDEVHRRKKVFGWGFVSALLFLLLGWYIFFSTCVKVIERQ